MAPDTVHVWRCDLRRTSADSSVLDAAEHDRARRFVFDRDRRRYIVAHSAMRDILARYLGIDAEALEFRSGAHGKPQLEFGGLEFNLTHSDDVCYVAIAGDAAVGIDVEVHRAVDDAIGLAATVFSPEERALLAAAAPELRNQVFLRTWTRKEAFLKTLGLGIGEDLQRITVGVTDDDRIVPPVPGVSSDAVYVRSVAAAPGEYVGVGSVRGFLRVETFQW